jgi:hypothetical protein
MPMPDQLLLEGLCKKTKAKVKAIQSVRWFTTKSLQG